MRQQAPHSRHLAAGILQQAARSRPAAATHPLPIVERRAPSRVQGTRRVVMRTALPRDFTAAVYNPLAMSSRGRYLLVEGLSTSNTSGESCAWFGCAMGVCCAACWWEGLSTSNTSGESCSWFGC